MRRQFNLLIISILLIFTTTALSQTSGIFANRNFPEGKYVPFGYIDNPWHSFVLNRSGILRTVPPVGMGYWCTSLPIAYASTLTRPVNYLSFLHIGFSMNGKSLIKPDDYANCDLHSSYHTKNVLRYDWTWEGVVFSASWYLVNEHALACRLEMKNTTGQSKNLTAHATHEYGYVERRWWGSTGITSAYDDPNGVLVNKIWEYGDVFVTGASGLRPSAVKATADETEWHSWIKNNDLTSKPDMSVMLYKNPALYGMESFSVVLGSQETKIISLLMARGTNQIYATDQYEKSQRDSEQKLKELLAEDDRFYRHAPRLEGDWPQSWKDGWVYDFETLRMTVRPPCGIYKHPWDGMQIYAPRAVLGETAMDMFCLSYADPELAKKVLFGVFADAPAANVPCSREDGSMNMISAGGDECGTSPVWGLPFSVIYSVYKRTADKAWLTSMYPYMKSFLEWWLANRTDKDGWFHCNNSWESGQDGSIRFTFEGGSEGDVSDFVRTVDVEAAMADAFFVMSKIAPLTGHFSDSEQWTAMAKDRIERMRSMYKDGWFRDVDGRNGQPIMLDTYGDVMMLLPLTTGLATKQQIKEIAPRLPDFTKGDKTLVWPPGIFFYTEAMRNTEGFSYLGADLIVSTGNRIYERMSAAKTSTTGRSVSHIPDKHNYRIPGVSNEFWPINLEKSNYGGAENYGWGATLPAMAIRSLFGYVESDNDCEFYISPVIPSNLMVTGKRFGISGLTYQNHQFGIACIPEKNKLSIEITCSSSNLIVKNAAGKIIARSAAGMCRVSGVNGTKYTILVDDCENTTNDNPNYPNNRYPLVQKPYMELPLGSIKAKGWLLEMLKSQKSGATGQLDILYPQVMGVRNGWLGGDGDQWERGPYWIDGLLPLAYILDDQKLKEKVQPWVEWALKSQRPDGYFGPEKSYPAEPGLQRNNCDDWWPRMVMLKILQQYYSATNDQRVLKLMSNYFRYQLKTLPEKPLGFRTFWAEYRMCDNLQAVYWLYNITGDPFLLELGDLLHKQGIDFTGMMLHRDDLSRLGTIHCVNLAQGIKSPVIYYQHHPEKKYIDAVKKGLEDIRRFNGQAQGMYGGDEALHGNNPTQGSELCSAVELMFSLEKMIEITGDLSMVDHLEKITFNALPTQISDDFMTRQYFQQANQVIITRCIRNFDVNHDGTDVNFGLLTGYPCCTSNMHQAWPKFTQNLWYATPDNGLAALAYSPSEVTAKVGKGCLVKITEDTYYPMDDKIRFTINIEDKKHTETAFPLHLRIPGWCKQAVISVNGKIEQTSGTGTVAILRRTWKNGDQVEMTLPMHVYTSRWHENSISLERGPLVYGLMMKELWKEKKFPENEEHLYGKTYFEVTSPDKWNYGIVRFDLSKADEYVKVSIDAEKQKKSYFWNPENAPVHIKVKAKQMPEWKLYNEMSGPLPYSIGYSVTPQQIPEEEITLIPYGCTTLRISQFPVVR